jgi:hypothetical protein
MKYLVWFVLQLTILTLVLPIVLIKWDLNGIDDLDEGIRKLCGIGD